MLLQTLLPRHGGISLETLLSAQEMADLLKVSLRKFEQMVKAGDAPPHIRLGRLRRWPVEAVNEWLEERLRESAEAPHVREEEN